MQSLSTRLMTLSRKQTVVIIKHTQLTERRFAASISSVKDIRMAIR